MTRIQMIPPRPPANETIDKEVAKKMTEQAKTKLFETERTKLYDGIRQRADNGYANYVHVFPQVCRRSDIIKLQIELERKGFEVEFKADINDILTISWY